MSELFRNPEPTDQDLILDWYNNALMGTPTEAADYLRKLQEVLLHKSPELLADFFPNILNFTTSTHGEVKRVLIGFIEEACKIDESLLPKVMINLLMLLSDESVVVQKRVIQAAISLYRKMLQCICKAPGITDELEKAWDQMCLIKTNLVGLIDSDNDGVRTSVVKFSECVVLLQSYPDPYDVNKNDFTLENVPLTLKIARRRKLEQEANEIFEAIIKFTGSPHISSANLFVCIGTLTHIAKNRPEYMADVVVALVSLSTNFPPTLSTTQVNSVKKKLKSELSGLLKHPAAHEYVDKITPVLLELGCSQNDINKLIPKVDENRRYTTKRSHASDASSEKTVKKPRLDTQDYDADRELMLKQKHAIEINETHLKEKLTKSVAAEIVLKYLLDLPASMPPNFKIDYADSLKLGPAGDISIVSKLLSEQMVESGAGPGSKIIGKTTLLKDKLRAETRKRTREDDEDDDKVRNDKNVKKGKVKVPKVKILKLNEITKPLERHVRERILDGAVKRLLMTEKLHNLPIRQKIITTVAASFNDSVRETVLMHVLKDLKNNLDLALGWLYEEYSIMQGFSRIPELRKSSRIQRSYNDLLCSFVESSASDAQTTTRLLLESPALSEEVIEKVKEICKEESTCGWGMALMRDLVIRRPTKQLLFLNALLENITHENLTVRERTIEHVVHLHKCIETRQNIEEYVKKCLDYLKLDQTPECLFGFGQGRLSRIEETWNGDLARACLEGYMALLPSNQTLIHDLAKVYIQTTDDVKRTILRLLETPVRAMGMDSPELLKLLQECPKGSETLVTRVIYVLTDKNPPTAQLVKRVRDLYNTRVSDVRFLIPVLHGLTKSEIIEALPKLIKLQPAVVREVFNRLLGTYGDSAVTPTELLVALHVLSTDQVDIKTKMKAITMCLNEKQVFTQEVLAVVLQQLMEQTPLPTLLMRTVIQALGLFPRLSGFVMNILQRLILKQVWKQKVAWEGFVKCCQRTKPQSFAVLMQLPAPQLTDALTMSADLREPLKEHLLSFKEAQRAHVPAAVQEAILGSVHASTTPPPVPQPASVPLEIPPPRTDMEPLPPGME